MLSFLSPQAMSWVVDDSERNYLPVGPEGFSLLSEALLFLAAAASRDPLTSRYDLNMFSLCDFWPDRNYKVVAFIEHREFNTNRTRGQPKLIIFRFLVIISYYMRLIFDHSFPQSGDETSRLATRIFPNTSMESVTAHHNKGFMFFRLSR